MSLSLLKEAIWLRLSTSAEGTWPNRSLRLATAARDDPGIGRLAGLVGMDAKQLAVIERACRADQKLLDERLDDRKIKKRAKKIAKDLASVAPGMGLPVAAVYLSGSVTGLSAQSEKLSPMAGTDGLQRSAFQQWVAELTTNAEDWAKVPYDVVKPKIGLTPNTHRVATIGHDPGLGLVFGTNDIIRGNCSFIDANGRWQVIQSVRAGEQGVLQALVKVIVHGFSDVLTPRGVPPPFLSALQALNVNSGVTLREDGDPVSVPNLIRHMYSNGYDLRHFATMAIVPSFAELAIRIYHYVRIAARVEALGKSSIRDRLKLSQMLMLTHSLLASGNVVKTALYGWNPTALNYAQFLALAKQMILLVKLSSERNRVIRKELADGWEALLDESRRLIGDRDRLEDQLDKAAP
ncbi:MAG: hypothetical protein OXH28_10855 [bacterium]|nr:hypothetical protein [bacterium]